MANKVIDLFQYVRHTVYPVDFNKTYKCPDCKLWCTGKDLKPNNVVNGTQLYVCPHCGCLQKVTEVERQLGNKKEA